MLNVFKTAQLYESYRSGGSSTPGGRLAFVNLTRHWLGLCDAQGNDHLDPAGNRILKEQKVRPESFSTDELADALLGSRTRSFLHDNVLMSRAHLHNNLVAEQHPGDRRGLLENVGVGIDVSAFADINAWTAVVGGLIEVKILEAFTSPAYIADRLAPAEPTKLNGQKIIGAARLGDKAVERQQGEPHARGGFGERWVQTPQTRENALAVDVLKEAIFFDLTGQLLQHAGQVGEWLGYRKELEVIDAFIGVSSQSAGVSAFNYMGTAYNTYSTSAQNQPNGVPLGYINQFSNELLDWTAFEAAELAFARFNDPETQTRVLLTPNLIVVNPGKWNTAKLILGAMRTEVRTSGGTTQASAPSLQVRDTPGAPYTSGDFEMIKSPLLEQRCTDATGLGLTLTNATKYWWMLQSGKPMRYMQNWPLTVAQAPPNQYDMLDRGVAASYFANERGRTAVLSPWHILRLTN